MSVTSEAARRRTFAIISHPDAGKTTLTEKFLLFAGALVEAGEVRARAGRRSATSDWMAMEQQRGISISSTVLQFEYRGLRFNLLDTPGHRDFSEDTFRVLTAVDAVIMVLDGAKGIEAQTLKLFEVCRARNLPIITFINKFDRPGKDALELLDEIEAKLILQPAPVTWPVGIAGDFRGVIDRRTGRFLRTDRTVHGAKIGAEEEFEAEEAERLEGKAWTTAVDECTLLSDVGSSLDDEMFRAGYTTPVFFGSAITNFGVRVLLDAVADMAPPPSPFLDVSGNPRELESPFSGFVFKMQANMDPSHRDRIAFVRVCSGRFERGMNLTRAGTGKKFGTKHATSTMGSERDTIDEAYPGDVVGLVNARDLRIGDTLYDDKAVVFPPIPSFEPEVFMTARSLDTSKFKQFRSGLAQLGDEGVVQVLRDPDIGDQAPVLAAVGPMQFEVFAHRLENEFGAKVELTSSPFQAARRTNAETAAKLRGVGGVRVLNRPDGTLIACFENVYRLNRIAGDNPDYMLERLITGTN
ncbi:MAG: peptide chain release factor 3 [Acidimicrobiia bacterium]